MSTTPTPDPTLAGPPPVVAPRTWRAVPWVALALLCLAVTTAAVGPYLTASLSRLSEAGIGLAANYAERPWPLRATFYVHIVTAGLALALGPVQFLRPIRRRWPAVHRATGMAYVVCVALGATSGLVIATVNRAGIVGFLGFGTLAVLWAVSTWHAVVAARRRDLANHAAWMIRGFALTFAAVTLRSWTAILILLQTAAGATDPEQMFANAYAAVPFLCWLPNVVVAEWLVRRRGLPSFRVVAARSTTA